MGSEGIGENGGLEGIFDDCHAVAQATECRTSHSAPPLAGPQGKTVLSWSAQLNFRLHAQEKRIPHPLPGFGMTIASLF